MTIRLEIAPGDHFDVTVPAFEELSVADHIRLFESNAKDEGSTPLEIAQNRLIRITGAPSRYIRYMTPKEVDECFGAIEAMMSDHLRTHSSLAKVMETLDKWEDEHEGKAWTLEDARQVMDGHGLFRQVIEVSGRSYTAPLIEQSATFGQWIDLQACMGLEGPESESYVRACSIMMDGQDGKYPVQGPAESDHEYSTRVDAWTEQRRRDFTDARFVDVLGCAAFFFSSSERFAAICGHSMSSLARLIRPSSVPERTVIPSGGEWMRSLTQRPS